MVEIIALMSSFCQQFLLNIMTNAWKPSLNSLAISLAIVLQSEDFAL